jgi:hypothetical protein
MHLIFVFMYFLLMSPVRQEEMYNLKTTSYEITIVYLKFYHKKCSLKLHFQTIFKDSNLFTSHILCLNETRIKKNSNTLLWN